MGLRLDIHNFALDAFVIRPLLQTMVDSNPQNPKSFYSKKKYNNANSNNRNTITDLQGRNKMFIYMYMIYIISEYKFTKGILVFCLCIAFRAIILYLFVLSGCDMQLWRE